MPVTGTPVTGTTPSSITVTDLIDKILGDLGQPTDGTGFWTRTDVLWAMDYIQREISRLTEDILATVTVEPATSATTITIDDSGNFIRGMSAYRTYGGTTKEIYFYTEEQVSAYDGQWKTRTSSMIRGIVTDIAAEGIGRIYPIPDNGDNDIEVNYIKLADRLSTEGTIEIPQNDIMCLDYGVKAMLYNMEKDGHDQGKGSFWKELYGTKDPQSGILAGELGNVKARVRKRRGATFGVLQERAEYGGVRTRPYYPWEA